MEDELYEALKRFCDVTRVEIDQWLKDEIVRLHSLWCLGIFIEPVTTREFQLYGHYYRFVNKNEKKAIKFYMKGIDLGYDRCMCAMGALYDDKKDYKNMVKYHLMAIENGNSVSPNHLALYYDDILKDYKTAKKYYELGVERGNMYAMNNLGVFYQAVEKNIPKAKKFYLMAIEKDYDTPCRNLARIYKKKNKDTKALYYFSLHKNLISETLDMLNHILKNDVLLDKYFFKSLPLLSKIKEKLPHAIVLIINLYQKEVDVLENAFLYGPGEKGYLMAKEDYDTRVAGREAAKEAMMKEEAKKDESAKKDGLVKK